MPFGAAAVELPPVHRFSYLFTFGFCSHIRKLTRKQVSVYTNHESEWNEVRNKVERRRKSQPANNHTHSTTTYHCRTASEKKMKRPKRKAG